MPLLHPYSRRAVLVVAVVHRHHSWVQLLVFSRFLEACMERSGSMKASHQRFFRSVTAERHLGPALAIGTFHLGTGRAIKGYNVLGVSLLENPDLVLGILLDYFVTYS